MTHSPFQSPDTLVQTFPKIPQADCPVILLELSKFEEKNGERKRGPDKIPKGPYQDTTVIPKVLPECNEAAERVTPRYAAAFPSVPAIPSHEDG